MSSTLDPAAAPALEPQVPAAVLEAIANAGKPPRVSETQMRWN